MNTQNKNIVKIVPESWIASGQKLVLNIERARQNFGAGFNDPIEFPQRLFQLALNEAAAIASETDYPQLFFPTLAEERIAAISAGYGHGGTLHSDYAIAV
ncbi:MAG TPA: hypothetical protein VGY98_09375 [Verrucomicrobiae bacterium]|nr:hypothetical protein [Verrucomicrobiae bacterium]